MPAVEEHVEQETEQEPDPLPGKRSESFNSMADKLKGYMAPFIEAAKPAEVAPAPAAEPPKGEKQKLVLSSPPKPEDKKVDPPVEDKKPDEELPESIRKSPKASEEFKKIRNTAQQFKSESEKHAAKAKSLEDEILKLKSTPTAPVPLPPEFESLKKEHTEYSEQLKALAIERHPSFRSHFESRTTAAIEKAKASVGPDVTDKAVKLAQLPPSEYRTEQLDKMLIEAQETSPSKAAFLSDLIRDINGITYDRELAIKKARDDYDVVQRHEAEKVEAVKAEQAKNRDAFTARALELAHGLEAFKRTEDPKVNAAVAEREEFVKALIRGEVDEELLPYIPVLAKEAEYLRGTVLPALREENAKLLKQISEMTQSTPQPGLTGGKPSAPAPAAGRGFVERYMANKPQA